MTETISNFDIVYLIVRERIEILRILRGFCCVLLRQNPCYKHPTFWLPSTMAFDDNDGLRARAENMPDGRPVFPLVDHDRFFDEATLAFADVDWFFDDQGAVDVSAVDHDISV